MLFKITLSKTALKQREHLIPSPKQLQEHLKSIISADYNRRDQLVRYFSKAVPTFRLPEYKNVGGKTVVSDNTIYVYYASTCPTCDERHIEEQVKQFDSFFGVKATWEISNDKVEYNCFQYKEGIEVEGINGPVYYLCATELPKAEVTFHAPQRMTLSITPGVPVEDGIKLTGAFHKYLVKEMPHNHQTRGFWGNSSIGEKESLNFSWNSTDGIITHLVIDCFDGISDEITKHFDVSRCATFFQEKVELCFEMTENEYIQIEKATKYKTTSTAYAIGTVETKKSQSLEKDIISNILTILGIKEDKITSKLALTCDGAEFFSDKLGKITIRVEKHQELVQLRGGRRAENPYDATIEFETPVHLHSIGKHRRFGAGKLERI